MGKKQKQKKQNLQNKQPQQHIIESTPAIDSSEEIQEINESQSKEQNHQSQKKIEPESHKHHGKQKHIGSQKSLKQRKINDEQKYPHYSWQEVGKHDHKDDLWVVINDKIYDITKFVDNHPGGAKPIIHRAGRNATKAFQKAQHPQHVLTHKLAKFKVGRITTDSQIESWQREVKTGAMDSFCALVLSLSLLAFCVYLAL